MRNFDHVYAEALTDDGKTDIMKMHDNGVATIDLLFAEMANGQVHAEYYYNPADYYSPQASEMIYESLGFEITKGYSAYGPDKRIPTASTRPSWPGMGCGTRSELVGWSRAAHPLAERIAATRTTGGNVGMTER